MKVGSAPCLAPHRKLTSSDPPARPPQLFCKARRPDLQAANPKAGMPEISKLLADAWKEVDEEEKAVFVERNKELKAAAKEAAAAGGTAGGEAAAAKPKKRGAAGPAGGGRKRVKQGAQAEGAAAASGGEEEEEEGGAAELMSDGEDDVDREVRSPAALGHRTCSARPCLDC